MFSDVNLKKFWVLNSTEHEISLGHKNTNNYNFSHLSCVEHERSSKHL